MAIGTASRFSSRFCAVTMISAIDAAWLRSSTLAGALRAIVGAMSTPRLHPASAGIHRMFHPARAPGFTLWAQEEVGQPVRRSSQTGPERRRRRYGAGRQTDTTDATSWSGAL